MYNHPHRVIPLNLHEGPLIFFGDTGALWGGRSLVAAGTQLQVARARYV